MAISDGQTGSRTIDIGDSSSTLPPKISAPVLTSGLITITTDAPKTSSATTFSTVISTYVTTDLANSASSTVIATSFVTDSSVYSSLQSAAAASAIVKTATSGSSNASSTSSTASASAKAASNLGIIIPAVVVPVAVLLTATFLAFWFFMRRRHRRDLNNQPAFVMAAKTEKLTSTTNSLSSDHEEHRSPIRTKATSPTSNTVEKPLPPTRTGDVSSRPPASSSSPPSDYQRGNAGIGRTSNVRDEQRPSPLLPPAHTDSASPSSRHPANFATKPSPTSDYGYQASRSANPHLNSPTPHNSVAPSPKNISGRGPPAGVGTSSHALGRNRSQSLTNPGGAGGNPSNPSLNDSYRNGSPSTERPPTAPNSGFRGQPPPRSFSPAGQHQRGFSPMGHRAAPPPPIKTLKSSDAFVNEPQYSPIVRAAHKAKQPGAVVSEAQERVTSYDSHTSPLLPKPQSPTHRDASFTAENLRIARLAHTSRLGFGSRSPDTDADADHDNISEISAPADDADADAKSDVSSLNELEKFNFERDTRGSGSTWDDNNHSHFLGSDHGHERPWS